MRFSTLAEAHNDVLNALGHDAGDYDTDAITAAAYEYRVDTDAHGNEIVTTAGFEQTVTNAGFWEIVRRHAK